MFMRSIVGAHDFQIQSQFLDPQSDLIWSSSVGMIV